VYDEMVAAPCHPAKQNSTYAKQFCGFAGHLMQSHYYRNPQVSPHRIEQSHQGERANTESGYCKLYMDNVRMPLTQYAT